MRWLLRALLMLALILVSLVATSLTVFRISALVRETDNSATTAPGSGRFIAAGDVNLFVQQHGPQNGPVVLFTHGAGAWSGAWAATANALAATGFRCITVDLPPFGYSSRPASNDYSPPAQALRLDAMLRALGVDRFALIGHSIGSRPAMELALASPSRVTAVVLLSAALGLDEPFHEASPSLRMVMNSATLRETLVATAATNPATTDLMVSMLVHRPLTSEQVDIFRRPLRLAGSTQAWGHWAQHVTLSTDRPASRNARQYRQFVPPVLLIWGDRDTVTPLHEGERLAGLLPSAILFPLDDVGHIPQLEDPARVHVLIETFLNRMVAAKLNTSIAGLLPAMD